MKGREVEIADWARRWRGRTRWEGVEGMKEGAERMEGREGMKEGVERMEEAAVLQLLMTTLTP